MVVMKGQPAIKHAMVAIDFFCVSHGVIASVAVWTQDVMKESAAQRGGRAGPHTAPLLIQVQRGRLIGRHRSVHLHHGQVGSIHTCRQGCRQLPGLLTGRLADPRPADVGGLHFGTQHGRGRVRQDASSAVVRWLYAPCAVSCCRPATGWHDVHHPGATSPGGGCLPG